MSAASIGSSGSSYGASGDSSTGGSGALTQSILGAVSLAGENVALLNAPAPLVVAPPHAPPMSPTTSFTSISGGASAWVVLLIVAVIAFFAYREL